MEAYGVSRTTVNHYLNGLLQDGVILRDKSKPANYTLAGKPSTFHYSTADGLDEDRIFNADIAPLLQDVANNVFEIMSMFSDAERSFFRTRLPLAHIFQNAGPVSRSEAKRLASMISRFEDVTLDFSGIKTLGQGFTHELFVVFRREHPEIQFSCVNMSDAVKSMIERVQNTK